MYQMRLVNGSKKRSYNDLSIENRCAPSVYYVRIDCTDGTILYKFGVTRHESVSRVSSGSSSPTEVSKRSVS